MQNHKTLAETPKLRISFIGLVQTFLYVAGAATVACTGTGFFGHLWWILDLTSHFRLQYFVASLLLAGICVCRRRWVGTLVYLALAGVNAAVLAPHFWLVSSRPASDPGTRVRAVLVNVHRANRRFDLVKEFLRTTQSDFVVMEEVNAVWMKELAELNGLFPHTLAAPREDDFGIALFSRHPLEAGEIVELGEAEVPSVFARIVIGKTRLTILGTHPLPPAGNEYSRLRNEQLAAIARFLNQEAGAKILIGDLNTTPWNYYFKQLVRATGLQDSSKGFGYQSTWPSGMFPLRIPLDHCLLSGDLSVDQRRVGPPIGSDHFPIIVEFIVK